MSAFAKPGQTCIGYDLGAQEPNVAVLSLQSVLPPQCVVHDSNWRCVTRLVQHHLRVARHVRWLVSRVRFALWSGVPGLYLLL
jgi:hypothetical protein